MVRPVTLVILDGFALREDSHGNAVALAKIPVLSKLLADYPRTHLATSGRAVGLPDEQMGNSEVGHQNIGAGRVVYQDLTRIDLAIEEHTFEKNDVLVAACEKAKSGSGRLHLMGLVSTGGVHASFAHLFAIVELARDRGVPEVWVHAFTDGRDRPPKSAQGFLDTLAAELAKPSATTCGIATVCGRYYAMDRDKRWDRVQKAWDAMVRGAGLKARSASAAVAESYARNENDEFILPTVIEGTPRIGNGDSVFFFNFRADRARELTNAFTRPGFSDFETAARPQLSFFGTMTRYEKSQEAPAAFAPQVLTGILGELISARGLKQLRIAETEKYAHVTYFFNGGEEKVFPGEERVLVPSPRDVATYDLKPQMSAVQVTDEAVKKIESGEFAMVVLNFANPDMVGHTGILTAGIAAMETIDGCVARIVDATKKIGGVTLVTADHGNCEEMENADGSPNTEHTLRDVPIIAVDDSARGRSMHPGALRDIAPTMLTIMGLPIGAEMTGRNLFDAA